MDALRADESNPDLGGYFDFGPAVLGVQWKQNPTAATQSPRLERRLSGSGAGGFVEGCPGCVFDNGSAAVGADGKGEYEAITSSAYSAPLTFTMVRQRCVDSGAGLSSRKGITLFAMSWDITSNGARM
jgi:hypothetical protein